MSKHSGGATTEAAQFGIDVNRPYPADPYTQLPNVPGFSLVSSEFANGQRLPVSASADGGSHSPALSWSGFPPNTKSFAITCFDPDAPRPGGFWHWLVLDVPATVTSLPNGAGGPASSALAKLGAQTLANDANLTHYAGARPPSGDHEHRYFFAVHALDTDNVERDPVATCAQNAAKLVPHTIARGVLMGTYQR